jgi:hypothetical protein
MSFIELFEAFDKPYKWKLINKNHNLTEFSFETGTEKYFVMLVRYPGGKKNITDVTFETSLGSVRIGNQGNAFRVFATIFDILLSEKDNIVSYGNMKFSADASEKSRVKLYDAMVKRFSKKMGYSHVDRDSNPSMLDVVYILSNKGIS